MFRILFRLVPVFCSVVFSVACAASNPAQPSVAPAVPQDICHHPGDAKDFVPSAITSRMNTADRVRIIKEVVGVERHDHMDLLHVRTGCGDDFCPIDLACMKEYSSHGATELGCPLDVQMLDCANLEMCIVGVKRGEPEAAF